ncbi:hypothetical protein [Paludibacterium denitrificans]|uniref:hypothetical protein n=1 Tax=Paludibacterium denitrificans TaxID=2675226 RepID=UPI001FD873A0|nr:hypothetical protein [Paludibacterium denitrificans]
MAYKIGDCIFVGDTLFMPDVGSARCDFPGGNAHVLYQSVQRLLSFPPQTRLFMCHDYPPSARQPQWQTTVAEQKQHNLHLRDGISKDAFVALRQARDAELEMPVLILLRQCRSTSGLSQLPPPEANGTRYLKIPLDAL